MREDAQEHFAPLRAGPARRERGPEAPLVAREHALGVPAEAVQLAWEAAAQRASLGRERPAPPHVARVERDHARRDAERAAEAVVVLRVVARVAEQRRRSQQAGGLAQRRGELGRVLRRPARHDDAGDQVRADVRDAWLFHNQGSRSRTSAASSRAGRPVTIRGWFAKSSPSPARASMPRTTRLAARRASAFVTALGLLAGCVRAAPRAVAGGAPDEGPPAGRAPTGRAPAGRTELTPLSIVTALARHRSGAAPGACDLPPIHTE